jgi:hypothetical protein
VLQVFLTKFIIESEYKKPIQNLDELFDSGIKLTYPPEYNLIFENSDELDVSKLQRNRVNCPSYNFVRTWQNIGRICQF